MNELLPTPLAPQPMKKWKSEPTLLGDHNDSWIKEWNNVEERGVSFTDEVLQQRLVHINKNKAQLRPKRRPPSRQFVKSRASMDFDIVVPEEIKEEEEEEEEEEEDKVKHKNCEEDHKEETVDQQTTPLKRNEGNAWKLPTIGPEIVLRKTPSADSKSEDRRDQDGEPTRMPDVQEVPERPVETPDSPQKEKEKEKGRRRFKLHIFKFRRSRRDKENRKRNGKGHEEHESDSNLARVHCMSVDSGTRALGDNGRKRWLHRHNRKSLERRRLSWLLGLFHLHKNSPDSKPDESEIGPEPIAGTSYHGDNGDTNSNNTNAVKRETSHINGKIPEIKIENDLKNGHKAYQDDTEDNPETVSDLRKKFERISAAF